MIDNNSIEIIASAKNWIEGKAVKQLAETAKLEGVKYVVGLPDLHPGKGSPVGAVIVTEGKIYPHLIGNDIGCGMSLFKTDLKVQKIKPEKCVSKLKNLDGTWDGDISNYLSEKQVDSTEFDNSLGTIGSGNHFAELQKIESVIDEELFEELNLSKKYLYLLVHSGSRGLGESILREHTDIYGAKGLQENTKEADSYINKHHNAVKWAAANRNLIAQRFLSCLGAKGELILDINHNMVEKQDINGKEYWLHRKGAAASTKGIVAIPGSRGNFSYLVKPVNNQENNSFSLPHGAGRKWKRTDSRGMLSKYKPADLTKTSLGGLVICENKDLLYEEAPQAYKNIEIVIDDMVKAGFMQIVATFRPLITYKTRKLK